MALINKLTAIGDKIREKLGIKDLINLSDIPAKIEEVFSKGKETQYDAFWDRYQNYGNLENYNSVFGGASWTQNTFKPKYNINALYCSYMFFNSTGIGDLAKLLENCGVSMDVSRVEYPSNVFSYATQLTKVPELNFSYARQLSNLFQECTKLKTVVKLIVSENGGTTFSNSFAGCTSLQNITFGGVIGKKINFSACPLSKESILDIFAHLSNNSSSQTLTLKSSAVSTIDWTNTLIDGVTYNSFDEICDLKPNWTISLV